MSFNVIFESEFGQLFKFPEKCEGEDILSRFKVIFQEQSYILITIIIY